MPDAPVSKGPAAETLGYWNAIQYLLTYSLGWTRHDRGLRWWYDHGKPTDDIRFALLSQLWDRDGNLDGYLEWVHSSHQGWSCGDSVLRRQFDPDSDELSTEWKRKLSDIRHLRSRDSPLPHPHGLHLEAGGHILGGVQDPDLPGVITISDADDRRAVFTAESMMGWYQGLRSAAEALPNVGNRSWRVDVFVKPVGFLGTYRKSRDTELWFSGRHRFHVVGQ